MTEAEHAAQVAEWRTARANRLRSPDGWLALVGLFWLTPGENHVGAHPANQVVLHGHEVPPRVGSVWVEDGHARFVPHEGVALPETVLEDDLEGHPTILGLGSIRFHLIRRDERLGIRVRDAAAPAIKSFEGIDHFPIDPSWWVEARFEPPVDDARIEITDVTGARFLETTPGTVVFERDGQTWRLAALPGDDDGSLEIVFGDATNGDETYPGGRFVYSEPPQPDGRVIVDFNLSYNPPCAFSPYATCPLPPAQNRLPIRIEAGEKAWHEAHAG